MRKLSLLLCLLVATDAGAEQPLPRITCNGVFQGFPASLNFFGASCTGIGGVNAVNVSMGAAAIATATQVGGVKGNGSTTACSGTDKMTGWDATGALKCAADQTGAATPGGLNSNLQINSAGAFGAYTGTSCAYAVKTLDANGAATCTAAPTLPVDISGASYITRVAEASLSNEFALGSLTSGLLLNTTTTGVPTIYGGATCAANQYMTALDASGAQTCSQVGTTQLSGTVTNAQLASTYSGTGACAAHNWTSTLNGNAAPTCTQPAYSDITGTPTIPADISGASYITQVSESSLSNEFALGSLATGILKNTTTTGVPTIAVSGTDYAPATSGTAVLRANGVGGFISYGGAGPCTNQFITGLSSTGSGTCTTATLASAQFANQGTTHTTLHGNAAGNPSWVADDLTADVTGVLPLANGGTNANLTAANGAVAYSGASALALSAVGTSGQILSSAGAGTPTWIAGPRFIRVSGSNFTTTSTTSSTITGLSFSAAINTAYYFHCAISMTGTATGGPRLQTNYSSTATSIVAQITHHTTATTTLLYQAQTTAAGTQTAACTASCLTGNIPFIVEGMLSANGAGTFALQAANSTSGQTTTVFIGSACVYWTP